MLRDNRFRLITLGRLTLVGAGGEEDASLARRRLKLAVLAVLALARRPIPRDTLLGLFWAEHDEARARHSLSNALSSLRGALGDRSITTRDADVALDPETPLDVDAIEFTDAIERRDHARAVDLYDGPFLEGFHVDESPAFEQWVSRERRRLESLFVKACAEHCASLARSRRWPECGSVANRWLDIEPLSADAAIYLLNAIKSSGTRAALAQALEEFEALRTRLNHEYELAPHPSVIELSTRIREQLATAPPEPVVNVRVTAETKIESITAVETPAPALSRPVVAARALARMETIGLGVAAAAVLLAALVFGKSALTGGGDEPAVTGHVIAVLSLPMRSDDSSSAWLSEGLPRMIDTKLASVSAIEVVPAPQVRAVIERSGRTRSSALNDGDARDLARRLGATLVAHGSLARDGANYVLELSVHDVRSGSLLGNAVLNHADPLALADQAAARILGAANVSLGGPRLAAVETSSLEAYQYYVRAMENAEAGRMTAAVRELDASIGLDSGFIPALRWKLGMVIGANDTAMARRLRLLLQQNAARATEFDRIEQELWDAFYAGEHERSAALARGLVRRFPRDPRAYKTLQSVLLNHGHFEEAQRVAEAGLALDSLAMRAGRGPCAQCIGFYIIVAMRWLQADFAGAATWSQRWIREQPDAPSAWATYAWTLSYEHKTDSALALMHRAVTLSGNELWSLDQYARILLVSRRYAAADSVIQRIESLHGANGRAETSDLRSLLAREHGRLHDSNRILDKLLADAPESAWFVNLFLADNRRLLGDYTGSARAWDRLGHGSSAPLTLPLNPTSARAICWHHALSADALGPAADTVALRAIADTLERGCTTSYYGRDWRLFHHVRGLLAMRTGRYAEAEREFARAVWTPVEGWSRTAVELARARMASGRPRDAIIALRTAYATRLDAMGRYVPISELDFWMARAFSEAGEADSARVYTAHFDRAWANADPDVRRQLTLANAAIARP